MISWTTLTSSVDVNCLAVRSARYGALCAGRTSLLASQAWWFATVILLTYSFNMFKHFSNRFKKLSQCSWGYQSRNLKICLWTPARSRFCSWYGVPIPSMIPKDSQWQLFRFGLRVYCIILLTASLTCTMMRINALWKRGYLLAGDTLGAVSIFKRRFFNWSNMWIRRKMCCALMHILWVGRFM